MSEHLAVQSDFGDPLEGFGGRFLRHRVAVEDGVDIRIFEWTGREQRMPPVVLVAGWITIVDSWVPVLARLAKDRSVVYIESREKSSANIQSDKMHRTLFSVERLGRDIAVVARTVGLRIEDAVLVGSSLGANAILEVLKQGNRCKAAFLIGPNAEFSFPLWARPVMRLPSAVYRSLVPFILWYLRRFRLDVEAEPQQYERYQRSVEATDFVRLKYSALALEGYRVIRDLDTIVDPVGVGFAASDRLHGETNARNLANALPRGAALPCPSNAYLHCPEVVDEIDRFVEKVS